MSEPAYEDVDFDLVEDVEDEDDSSQYVANPFFAAGNNTFVDCSEKQQSISLKWLSWEITMTWRHCMVLDYRRIGCK